MKNRILIQGWMKGWINEYVTYGKDGWINEYETM